MSEKQNAWEKSKMAAAGIGSTGFTFGGASTGGIGATAFGASVPQTVGFSAIKPFGAAAPTIKTTTATTASPLQFGGAAAPASSTGFSFSSGLSAPTAATSGLTLGAFKATATGFGQPASAISTASGLKLTTSTPATGLTYFGQPGSIAGIGPGITLGTSTTSTGLTLGGLQKTTTGGLFSSTQPKTTGTTLLLGGTTTSTPSVGFGLASTSGTGVLGGGLTGVKAPATSTATAVIGLGGTGTSTTLSTSGPVTGIADKQSEVKNLKETALPGPLNEIVEHIKKYVKEQKEHRDEISRFSASTMHKVQEENASQRQSVAVVLNSIQRDGCAVENLKMDVAQELKNAEIAQRTSEIPPALQHENIAPQEYFQRLMESFEERMQVYRKQIEIMESHLASLSQGQTLTPQDLSQVMHRVHETFIALAAELHGIHEAVKLQKDHYMNYRKAYFKDPTDVFAARSRQNNRPNAEVGVGPSPFSTTSNTATVAAALNATAGISNQVPGLGVTGFNMGLGTAATQRGTTLGASMGIGSSFAPGFGTCGTFGSTGGFGRQLGFGGGLGTKSFAAPASGTSVGFSFGTPANSGLGTSFGTPAGMATAFGTQQKFELQRPPAGSKRGKKR